MSDFSNDEFSAVDWVNKTLKNAGDTKDNKETIVNSFVSKLQLYVQQVNSSIEDTSQQVLLDLPKVVRDVQNLQRDAMVLKSSINDVEKQVAKVQEETGDGMKRLEYLDNIQTKLQSAKQGLQESDSWGALISELDDLLEHNDIMKACEKLFDLQTSLVAQRNLPGQVERTQQVEDFKNRVEALASIPVVQSFESGNVEESKKFVRIFKDMERFEQLTQYYRTVQKAHLMRQWVDVVDNVNANSSTFLREFYDFLLEQYQKQSKWCCQVFESPFQALLTIVELLNNGLKPTRDAVVTSLLKQTDEKLSLLKDVSLANISFGQSMKKLTLDQDQQLIKALANAIFTYFGTFISQYAAIEQGVIGTKLAELTLVQNSAAETVRSINSANTKVILWANEAVERCHSITDDFAIGPLVSILNNYFKTFLEKYKKAQKQIEASKSKQQDWSLLQVCIALMQNMGDLYLQVETLEDKLADVIKTVNEKINSVGGEPFSYKIPGTREEKELKKLMAQVVARQEATLGLTDAVNTEKHGILGKAMEVLYPLCGEIHETLLSIIFAPVEEHLKQVAAQSQTGDVLGASTDLPDYSFVPQEYITLVGQYILTLPQHLEPLLLSPAASLKTALELSDQKYVQNEHSADVLLSLIAMECCSMLQEQVFALNSLSANGAKQLATDIEYLGSVLEELGFSLGNVLQQTMVLLKAPEDTYIATSAGCDARLVTKIKQIRNIATIE